MSSPPAAERSPSTNESQGEPSSDASDLSLDVVFDVLSNERRRRVIRHLQTESSTTTLGDLAEHIASIENDKPEEALSSTERKRVYICLYQAHLPKMDDADVIDFEADRKAVRTGSRLDQVARFLPEEPDAESAGRSNGMLEAAMGWFNSSRLRP